MPRILVVDDDTARREQLYDALAPKGHQVLAASSSAQLFELLKTQRADLIVLDMAMPRMPGPEIAKKLRSLDATVPIVMTREPQDPELSADDRDAIQCLAVLSKEPAEAFLAGIHDILAKLGQPAKAKVQGPGVKATVMTIDDDDAARKMAKFIFQSRGFRVVEASSGEDALQKLDEEEPQIILCDLTMPGMDGLMTLKKIKAKKPNIPVVMVSARGENETVREALKAGAYDYVTKPFSIDYLESTVLTKVLVGMEGSKA